MVASIIQDPFTIGTAVAVLCASVCLFLVVFSLTAVRIGAGSGFRLLRSVAGAWGAWSGVAFSGGIIVLLLVGANHFLAQGAVYAASGDLLEELLLSTSPRARAWQVSALQATAVASGVVSFFALVFSGPVGWQVARGMHAIERQSVLAESERQMKATIATAADVPDLIIGAWNAKGEWTLYVGGGLRQFGQKPEDLLGSPARDDFPTDKRQHFDAIVQGAASRRYEVYLTEDNAGATFNPEAAGSTWAVQLRRNDVPGAGYMIARNITSEREALRKVEEYAEAMAKRASETQSGHRQRILAELASYNGTAPAPEAVEAQQPA